MARDTDRDDAAATGEEMVRDGNLIIEDRINRRDGLVEYEGSVAGGAAAGTSATVGETISDATTQVTTTEVVTTETVPAGTMDAGAAGAADAADAADAGDALSMSTDNTSAGTMAETAATGPITLVREGMTVFDAAGEEIGTVDQVQMGDPSAVTTMGQDAGDGGGGGLAAAPAGLAGGSGGGMGGAGGGITAFGGGGLDLPESFAADLRRVGFVKIDGKGLFSRDRYAAADEIATVSGDGVRLSVGKDALRTS